MNDSRSLHFNSSSYDNSNNNTNYNYDYYDYDINESFNHYNWAELGPSLFVYTITFCIGVIGNVLILLAVVRSTHVKNSPVNVFLASLASADLMLILICLPLKVAKLFSYTWTLGEIACSLLYYMQTVSCICSVLNLTALSIERFYAIVHPLKAQYLCTISKAKKTVLCCWVWAFLLGVPILFVQIHLEVGVRRKGYWCTRDLDNKIWWRVVELYLFSIILIIPTIIMSISYGKIIKEVCKVVKKRSIMTHNFRRKQFSSDRTSNKKDKQLVKGEATCSNEEQTVEFLERRKESSRMGMLTPGRRHSASLSELASKGTPLSSSRASMEIGKPVSKKDEETKQVVRMLISIVVVYILCWGPLLTFNVLQAFGYVGDFLIIDLEKYANTVISLMAYFNSCLNPIIYGFMSKNFRQSFISQLRACFCCIRCRREANCSRNTMHSHDSTRLTTRLTSVATTTSMNQRSAMTKSNFEAEELVHFK